MTLVLWGFFLHNLNITPAAHQKEYQSIQSRSWSSYSLYLKRDEQNLSNHEDISLFPSDCILQQKARHLCQIISELHPKRNLKLTVNSDQVCSLESDPRVLGGASAVIECSK